MFSSAPLPKALRADAAPSAPGLGLADVAGKDLTAYGKAAAVQDQGKGHQRAIRALLLGVTPLRLRIPLGHTLEEGIGQVVEGDGLVEGE